MWGVGGLMESWKSPSMELCTYKCMYDGRMEMEGLFLEVNALGPR